MIINNTPPLHLTYCLNVHKGESWEENFAAIREKTLAVRDGIAAGGPFGLGLRLSHRAVQELQSPVQRHAARDFFDSNHLYVFTINGFPYGQFHDGRVKENVYLPDWRSVERRDYTLALAHILAEWLPHGIDGSISTVPCSFKPWIKTDADVEQMVIHLTDVARRLHEIHQRTGKEIHLGLEPEPGCYLETTEETVRFFNDSLFNIGAKKLVAELGCNEQRAEAILRRHIGVCFDTCHVAIQHEDLTESLRRYEAEGIRISKIQVSAALRTDCSPKSLRALQAFNEPVYFHQVKAKTHTGEIISWDDLPGALLDLDWRKDVAELRVHFHVPLFVEKYGVLESTADTLTPAFFAQLRKGQTSHLEIETYTFDVLPEELRANGVTRSIVSEIEWFLVKKQLHV